MRSTVVARRNTSEMAGPTTVVSVARSPLTNGNRRLTSIVPVAMPLVSR
jgi:hypothetical protein